jgi:hypothetical protein
MIFKISNFHYYEFVASYREENSTICILKFGMSCVDELNEHLASVNHVVEFLTKLFHEGSSCSALNTARRALSSFVVLLGEDKIIFVNEHLVKR